MTKKKDQIFNKNNQKMCFSQIRSKNLVTIFVWLLYVKRMLMKNKLSGGRNILCQLCSFTSLYLLCI